MTGPSTTSLWFGQPTALREPLLDARIAEMKRIQEHLSDALARDFGSILARAEAGLARRDLAATDLIWRALHELRHLLCEHGSVEQLIRVAGDIRADLDGPANKTDLDELLKLEKKLLESTVDGPLRHALLRLSLLAADARESAWRRANRVMTRRRWAAWWMGLCAALLILGLPLALEAKHCALAPNLLEAWLIESGKYLLLALCGAIGGFLSGLLREERVDMSSIDHRLALFTFKLRPAIGAVAALVAGLLLQTKLLSVEGVTWWGPGLLVFGVAVGFSERFLLGQIVRLAGEGPPDAPPK